MTRAFINFKYKEVCGIYHYATNTYYLNINRSASAVLIVFV